MRLAQRPPATGPGRVLAQNLDGGGPTCGWDVLEHEVCLWYVCGIFMSY